MVGLSVTVAEFYASHAVDGRALVKGRFLDEANSGRVGRWYSAVWIIRLRDGAYYRCTDKDSAPPRLLNPSLPVAKIK